MTLRLDFNLLTKNIIVTEEQAKRWNAQNTSTLRIPRNIIETNTPNGGDEGFYDSNVIGEKITQGQDVSPVGASVQNIVNNVQLNENENTRDEGIEVDL